MKKFIESIINFIKGIIKGIINFIKGIINFIKSHIIAIIVTVAIIAGNYWFIKSAYFEPFLKSELVRTNAFNFLIMVLFFAILTIKLNLLGKIDDAISKIKEDIENSELAKSNSIEELEHTNEQVKNVGEEIKEIENKAQENIFNLEKKITQDSENQVNTIKKNADKLISAREREIISKLSKKTVLASFELAKKHIKNLLEQHPEYHQKFIKESIEELNRLK